MQETPDSILGVVETMKVMKIRVCTRTFFGLLIFDRKYAQIDIQPTCFPPIFTESIAES